MTSDQRVLVLATANPGKVAEIEPLLAPMTGPLGLALVAAATTAGPKEDRQTFAGNAALKAFAAAAATGHPALGEDSGLEVEALGGAPGVSSARWSGLGPEANNRLLLERLSGVPAGARGAAFRTVAVLKVPGGPAFVSEGRTGGSILESPAGSGGFGYDPVFFSSELGRAFAEVSRQEKSRVSHRARALRALRGYVFEVFDDKPDAAGGRRGGLPGHAWCLGSLERAGCSGGLIAHQVAVARACREVALLLREAGHDVDPGLSSCAGLLHDIGKGLAMSGQVSPGEATGLGARPPEGVTSHAWYAAAWTAERGLDPRLARTIMSHGLDSLLSPAHCPRTWEEKTLMLCDKLVECSFVGVEARLSGMKGRHPESARMMDRTLPLLLDLEEGLARACRLEVGVLRQSLRACLDVLRLGPEAEAADVEAAWEERSSSLKSAASGSILG